MDGCAGACLKVLKDLPLKGAEVAAGYLCWLAGILALLEGAKGDIGGACGRWLAFLSLGVRSAEPGWPGRGPWEGFLTVRRTPIQEGTSCLTGMLPDAD